MTVSKDFTVKASVGLHARPAAEFVKLAQSFNGNVQILKEESVVDGKSMIGILKLAIKQGEVFTLTLEGEDEELFILKFQDLLNKEE